MIVQTNGVVQDILTALDLRLDQGFFNFGHFFVELLTGIGNDFRVRIVFQAFIQCGNLPANIANLIHSVMRLGHTLMYFHEQIKLFFQVLLSYFQPGISFDLQRSGR